jgi:hypothetical protein
MKKTKIGFILAILFIALFSCQKNDDLSLNSDELILKSAEIAASDITLQSILEETNYEAELFAQSEMWLRQLARFQHGRKDLLHGIPNPRYANGQYPVVSIDTAATGYPIKITIDYGDKTVLQHGRELSGVVTIEISSAKATDGATRTITYTNCKVDSIGVEGTTKEVFNGDNATTRKITNTSDVKFVLADGTKLTKTGNELRDWMSGVATQQNPKDDTIKVTGKQNISSSTGDSWTKNIKEPLIKTGLCRHYVKGIVEYSVKGSVAVTLDYGDGTCDDTATVTYNGKTVDIALGGKMAKPDIDGFHKRFGKH